MKVIKKVIKKIMSSKNNFKFKFNKVKMGKNNYLGGKFFIRNRGEFNIGNSCCLRSGIRENPVGLNHKMIFDIKNGGKLSIGNNVGISNSVFSVFKEITIEDDVMIGSSVQIYDSDHHSLNYEKRITDNYDDLKNVPVCLKKGCFIGTGAIILKGVTIGEKSIIGAGSVVTKSVPDNEIWAGNPAKFIRKI